VIEVTDRAIEKLLEKKVNNIRLGLTGGGCAGFEYFIEHADPISDNDTLIDYGKFNVVLDELSKPYLSGSTLDWINEGLNEYFKIINPKEKSVCGCGVSVQFEDIIS
jgi:iron-sulfur cluster assembly accessory protein